MPDFDNNDNPAATDGVPGDDGPDALQPFDGSEEEADLHPSQIFHPMIADPIAYISEEGPVGVAVKMLLDLCESAQIPIVVCGAVLSSDETRDDGALIFTTIGGTVAPHNHLPVGLDVANRAVRASGPELDIMNTMLHVAQTFVQARRMGATVKLADMLAGVEDRLTAELPSVRQN